MLKILIRALILSVVTSTTTDPAISLDSSTLRPPSFINSKTDKWPFNPDKEVLGRLDKVADIYSQDLQNLPLAERLTHLAWASDILLEYLYSGNKDVREKAQQILNSNPDRRRLFVIRYRGEQKRDKLEKPHYKGRRLPSEKYFDYMVKSGMVCPVVIVNIRRTTYGIERVYIEEMKEISKLYNGNVTFILMVEAKDEFLGDMTGFTEALRQARLIMGDDFDKTLTIQIAAGGFKTRLGVVSLRYGEQDLIPYRRNRSYLRELLIRSGRIVMQLPNRGIGDHIICANDTIAEPPTLYLSCSPKRMIQIGTVNIKLKDILNLKEPIALATFNRGKPQARLDEWTWSTSAKMFLGKVVKEHPVISGLFYLLVWNKRILSDYMHLVYEHKIGEKESFVNMPIDLHMHFSRSVCYTERGWKKIYKANITRWRNESSPLAKLSLDDWLDVQRWAFSVLGNKAKNVGFVPGKIRDEGRIQNLITHYRKPLNIGNTVSSGPGITLVNAAGVTQDRVIYRGTGTIIFGGPNIKLVNVIIELIGNEILVIPDNWIIIDSYIGKNTFEKNGGLLIGATYYEEGRLLPLRDKVIRPDSQSSIICKREGRPFFIWNTFNKPTEIYVEGATQPLSFLVLQGEADSERNRIALGLLRNRICDEFAAQSPISLFLLNDKTPLKIESIDKNGWFGLLQFYSFLRDKAESEIESIYVKRKSLIQIGSAA